MQNINSHQFRDNEESHFIKKDVAMRILDEDDGKLKKMLAEEFGLLNDKQLKMVINELGGFDFGRLRFSLKRKSYLCKWSQLNCGTSHASKTSF